jgi:hypothetical protein
MALYFWEGTNFRNGSTGVFIWLMTPRIFVCCLFNDAVSISRHMTG